MHKYFFKIRNYHSGDFDSYVRLHIESNMHDRSRRHISKQSIAENLEHPSFHPQNDLFIAERDGTIIGYTSVFLEPGIRRALLDGLIHPRHRKKGIAIKLFHHALRHAKEAGSKVAQICIQEDNLAAKRLTARMGLGFVRCFCELRLDLENLQLPSLKPGAYIIRSLGQGDEDKLTEVQNRAFAGSWGFNPNTKDEIEYRINSSGSSPENIFMAYQGNKPIAYCWTRMIIEETSAADRRKGEIHMLGVDPDFRRKGIGRNVLLNGLSLLKRKGIAIVELTADSEDPTALGLYHSLGFEINSRSEWYQKDLT